MTARQTEAGAAGYGVQRFPVFQATTGGKPFSYLPRMNILSRSTRLISNHVGLP
jgi:hypothetical protein